MEDPHLVAGIAGGEAGGELSGHFFQGDPLGIQLREPLDAGVNIPDAVPGGLADDAVGGELENALELPDGVVGLLPENAVDRRDLRDARVIPGDAVELHLLGAHIVAPIAEAEGQPGIRGGVDAHRCVGVDVDVGAVELGQDVVRAVALLREGDSPPLGEAVAGDGGAVAVLGEVGLDAPLPDNIFVEDVVHDVADIGENIPAVDIGLIVPGGIGDVEIVALAAVPFGVKPVERIGDLRVDIGAQRILRPGGIDLARGDVFDIIRKCDRDVLCARAGRAQVHGEKIRNVGFSVQSQGLLLKSCRRGYRSFGPVWKKTRSCAESSYSGRGIMLTGWTAVLPPYTGALTLSTRKKPGA